MAGDSVVKRSRSKSHSRSVAKHPKNVRSKSKRAVLKPQRKRP